MRKYEQKQSMETIKKLAGKWPLNYLGKPIVKSGETDFVIQENGCFYCRTWEGKAPHQFEILPPEISLEEAKEAIKTKAVYGIDSNGLVVHVISFLGITDIYDKRVKVDNWWNENDSPTGYSEQSLIYYSFDPTPFADLLEEVEEKQSVSDRPLLPTKSLTTGELINESRENFKQIYKELDRLNRAVFGACGMKE